MGILEGLNLAWDLGYRKVELETDSQNAVELIQKYSTMANAYTHILSMINCILGK